MDYQEQGHAHRRGRDGGEEGVGYGVAEYAACVVAPSERGERGGHGKRDGRHGKKLEQARVDRRHEVGDMVNPRHACESKGRAYRQGTQPKNDLLGIELLRHYMVSCFVFHLQCREPFRTQGADATHGHAKLRLFLLN